MTKEEIKYVSIVAQIEILETLLAIDKRGAIEKILAHLKEEVKKYT